MKRIKKSFFMKTGFILLIIFGIIMFVNSVIKAADYPTGSVVKKRIENSPNFRDGRFRNGREWVQPSFKDFFSTMWAFLFEGENRTPDKPLPRGISDLTYFGDTARNGLNVTWLGHSSLMINIDGYRIMTDPVFKKKVSIFGPTRYNGNVPVNVDSIPNIDVVIISHNHYDHLNRYSIKALEARVKRFIVPIGVGAQLLAWDVPESKIIELDWWEGINLDSSLQITAAPGQHFSGRGLTDRDAALWASFVIKTSNHKVFFGGDSGYFDGFKLIGEKYGPFDMTFLECGAYNERWHHIHMFPEETVQAHLDLKGKVLHPIHWGTFNLSLHPWYEPMERMSRAAAKAGVTTATPIVGGTTVYGRQAEDSQWWNGRK